MLTLSALILLSIPAATQDFDLGDIVNVSWCVGTKIYNQNGLVRDCQSTPKTPSCRERSAGASGGRLILAAHCIR